MRISHAEYSSLVKLAPLVGAFFFWWPLNPTETTYHRAARHQIIMPTIEEIQSADKQEMKTLRDDQRHLRDEIISLEKELKEKDKIIDAYKEQAKNVREILNE